jgi:glycine hydroxymethyltransferase
MEYEQIKNQDKEIFDAIMGETAREEDGLELIPSENYVSMAVREANGSVLTNKYSEGYPGRRYYGGQDFTDAVERLAISRACQLFDAKFANVQPHSGAPANLAVYAALLEPGDTVMGMDLSHGGHLTHGHPMTFPAKIYKFVTYKMKDPDTGEIDYEDMLRVAKENKPKLIIAGFSAYPRTLNYKKFVDIAHEVGAITMADMAHIAGLIAAGVARNPFEDGFDIITTTTHKTLRGPRGGMILTRENEEIAKKIDKAIFPGIQGGPHMHTIAAKAVAFGEALRPEFKVYATQILKNAKAMEEVFRAEGVRMIGGGTDNHLILADVFGSLGVTGKEAQTVLDEVGMTLNMNSIAGDTRKPLDPSGIRFGTPAITTRGFVEADCAEVARLLIETLRNKDNAEKKAEIKAKIKVLAHAHPIPKTFI